jgi:glutamate-5-semialdehyde dehydrogenase
MIEILKKIKLASQNLLSHDSVTRNKVLSELAKKLKENQNIIIEKNQIDLSAAKEKKLASSLIDRLKIDESVIDSMILGINQIRAQEDLVKSIESSKCRVDGLIIKEQLVPIGVILMIFESRPNVVIDSAALSIKSGNAIILKGGKEAYHSNKILGEIVQRSLLGLMDEHSVTVLPSNNRDTILELIQQKNYINVVIPRGGEKLVEFIYDNSKIPVIAHFKGLCHIYIDKECNQEDAIKIIVNAKTQRTGVCNAIETLILHKDLKGIFLDNVLKELKSKGTKVILDKNFNKPNYDIASQDDWFTEYLDNILSIKQVDSLDEAIEHIRAYGSNHSEAILSNNQDNIDKFISSIDASCIMVNASTRFNDGSELGLGAELGISTSKLHAYGPMGAKQMMTKRYLILGAGHIRK